MFRRALVRRLLPHGIVFFILWPLASTLAGTLELMGQSATARLPWLVTFGMLMRAQPRLASEWLFLAFIGSIVSILLFSVLSVVCDSRPISGRWLAVEPLLLMVTGVAGIATEYPAVMAHPFLRSLRPLTVLVSILVLTTITAALFLLFGYRAAKARGAAAWLAAFTLVFAGSAFGSRLPARRRHGVTSRRSIVLLGIDSLSQVDDLRPLERFTAAHRGFWHPHAVTPGLVTNAVWSSILAHRPVRETGVWAICMSTDWRRKPYNLVAAAHRAGLVTRSFFSDQFTSFIGSDAGFDIDHSGPMGWLQLATATLKQNSVFLAVVLPRLPRLPGARTARNQSGTFAFDIPAEIEDALKGPSESQRTFSAGHLDYLHQPLYPRFSELTPTERTIVLHSPVSAVEDLSFDWQYPRIPGDSLGLYPWKVRHVQKLVSEALDRTGFLDPSRENRLIVFSDHGSRRDLTEDNVGQPKYWNVLLATFGALPSDPGGPVSLLQIPRLLGLADPTRSDPDVPAVEFAGVGNADIPNLTPFFSPDGRIFLDPRVLARIGQRIKEYRPFSSPGVYFPTPAF